MGKQPFSYVVDDALTADSTTGGKKPFDYVTEDKLLSQHTGENQDVHSQTQYDKGYLSSFGNLNTYKSRQQPWYDQLGNSLAKLVPGAALSLVESIGDLGELFDVDKDKEYSNAFTELALKGKEGLDETFKTYQEGSGNKFPSIHDSGWWFNFGDGVVQSIAGFYAIGAGVGKVLSTSAKLLTGAMRSGQLGIKVGQGVAQGLTATALSYTEGVQIGAGVYQTIKADVLKNGYDYGDGIKVPVDETEAKRIASIGSAEAVKLNTILGTGINITGLSPLFKSYGKLSATVKAGLPRAAGESLPKWMARLNELEKTIPAQASPLKFLAQESAQEAFEEGGINLYSESEGYRKSGAAKNMVRSDIDDSIDRFADILFSEEGAVNALGGALGGVVQSGGLEHLPMHTHIDKDGNSKLVSARTLEGIESNEYKNELIHGLREDVNTIQTNQQALNNAVAKGDKNAIEVARHNLFNVAALKSMRNETVDALSTEIAQFGQVDNTKLGEDGKTDAVRQGLADDTNDNKYRETASQKAADLHTLNKEFRNISAIFDNHHAAEEAFRKRLNIYTFQSIGNDIAKEIASKEADLHSLITDPQLLQGIKYNAELKAYDHAITHLETKVKNKDNAQTVDKEIQTLKNEQTEIKKLNDDLNKNDRSLSSKVKANQGLSNPIVQSYMDKLITDRFINMHKQIYAKIIEDPKGFTKSVKSQVDAIAKETIKKDNAKATVVEKQKEQVDQKKASEDKKEDHLNNKKRTNELLSILSDEDKELATKITDPEKRAKWIKTQAIKVAPIINSKEKIRTPGGNEIIERHEAEDALNNPNSTLQERIMATMNLAGNSAFNPAAESDINKALNSIKEIEEREGNALASLTVWERQVREARDKVLVEPKKESNLASDQLDAINLPANQVYQGKTEEEVETEMFALTTLVNKNNPEDNKTYGSQNRIAYLSQDYTEMEGGGRITDNPFTINRQYKLLHSPSFGIGSSITLELAPESEYVKRKGKYAVGSEYRPTDQEGEVVDVAYIPIKILYNGELMGFVHEYDPERDSDELLDLRKYLVANKTVTTKIVEKTMGALNTTPSKYPVSEAFPIIPRFAIGKNNKAFVDVNTEYSKPLVNKKEAPLKEGFLYAMITTPNGKEIALPLDINRVSKDIASSITKALDLFLRSESLTTEEESVVQQVFTNYNINLKTRKGLQDYINLFVATTDMSDSKFINQVNNQTDKDRYYISTSTKGIAYIRSQGAVTYKDKNGVEHLGPRQIESKDTPEYKARLAGLEEFITHTYARMDLKRIADNEEFKAPILQIVDGKLVTSEAYYKTYSEYVAEHSTTNIRGVRLSDTEQTTFAQPMVFFDTSFLKPKKINKSKEKAILASKVEEEKSTKVVPQFGSQVKEASNTKVDPNRATLEQAKEMKKEC